MRRALAGAGLVLISSVKLAALAQAQSAGAVTKAKASQAVAAPTVSIAPERAAAGRAKALEERCASCHGELGQGPHGDELASKGAPKLAGQELGYLLRQFSAYRSGQRKHEVMTPMARVVDEEDAQDILHHFAAQAPMHSSGEGSSAGAALYANPIQAAGATACSSCHGPQALGNAPLGAPRLAGQSKAYLERQLSDFRQGWRRHGSPAAQASTQGLSEAEASALAQHLSALAPISAP